MPKNLIALAIAAAFTTVAFAQAPAVTPAKPATATVVPATPASPMATPEMKNDAKKAPTTAKKAKPKAAKKTGAMPAGHKMPMPETKADVKKVEGAPATTPEVKKTY